MARSLARASSQRLVIASALGVSTTSLSMACWFYPTDTSNEQTLLELSKTAGDGVYKYRINLRGDLSGSSKVLQAQQNPGYVASATTAYTANAWHHGAGVFTSSSSRTVYYDGGNSATDTTGGSMFLVDQMSVGAAWNAPISTWYVHYSGYIAEIGFWSVALTASEVAALAQGISPLQIRPAALVAYYPLGGHHGNYDVDRWKNRHDLTAYNSPTWTDHPRVIYPRRRSFPVVATVAPPAASPHNLLLLGVGT